MLYETRREIARHMVHEEYYEEEKDSYTNHILLRFPLLTPSSEYIISFFSKSLYDIRKIFHQYLNRAEQKYYKKIFMETMICFVSKTTRTIIERQKILQIKTKSIVRISDESIVFVI